MNPEQIHKLLTEVQNGACSVDDALTSLKNLPYEEIGVATIDHHRALRQGTPEVIFGQNKETCDILRIIEHMRGKGSPVLATRVRKDSIPILVEKYPEIVVYERSSALTLGFDDTKEGVGNVLVISAGTSDMHIAEEAVLTARFTGSKVVSTNDVGVAGIHRLFGKLDLIRNANVIVVVAGMEGALAGVVGGLSEVPVIGVPTSVGYGANFGGLSALLTMLNSCSAGVTVVNIDNGFGAGFAASQINKKICAAGEKS